MSYHFYSVIEVKETSAVYSNAPKDQQFYFSVPLTLSASSILRGQIYKFDCSGSNIFVLKSDIFHKQARLVLFMV